MQQFEYTLAGNVVTLFSTMLEEINEKSPLAAAMVAPKASLPIRVSGADDIEFCVPEAGSELFNLACKREGDTVNVTFTGLGGPRRATLRGTAHGGGP